MLLYTTLDLNFIIWLVCQKWFSYFTCILLVHL